jgi:hypothetical protein
LIAAYQVEQAVETIVENYQNNARGADPCALAINAMDQAIRAIRSLEKVVAKHEGWIRDPSTYPGVIRDIDDARRAWEQDIARARDNIAKNTRALEKLRELVEKACWCWYWPWYRPWER